MMNFITKGNKYKNEKVTYDGHEFASKLEMKRYIFLKGAEDAGQIENLKCQVEFSLLPKQTYIEEIKLKTKVKFVEKVLFKEVKYIADFVYTLDGKVYVEDTKGSKFIIDSAFKLKQKMMYYTHHILVRTIFKATEPLS